MSDEELVSQVVQGNISAYEHIVSRYEPKLRKYINYLLSSTEHTDDILQETFINAYVNINSFNLSKKFSSWLYRIAHNKAIDYVRKTSGFRINIGLDILPISIFDKETPESAYEKEMISKSVKHCLTQLPLSYKEILTLYYLEDKSYEEIRDILHLNINNIGVRLSRGKKILRDICEKGENNV